MASHLPARRRIEERKTDEDETAPHQEGWRAFDSSTEAGRLLRRLYAAPGKPQVQYPAVKTRKQDLGSRKAFVPGGGRPEEDPRVPKSVRVELDVPRQRPAAAPRPAAIDLAPHRRSETTIRQELSALEAEMATFRPAHRKAVSTEKEKMRLQNRFTLKGGKALPDELTLAPIEGEIPLAMQMGRVGKCGRGRSGRTAGGGGGHGDVRSEEERMYQQVKQEIAEREKFLARMRALGGARRQQEREIALEIQERVRDMEMLERLMRQKQTQAPASDGHGADRAAAAPKARASAAAGSRGAAGAKGGRTGPRRGTGGPTDGGTASTDGAGAPLSPSLFVGLQAAGGRRTVVHGE